MENHQRGTSQRFLRLLALLAALAVFASACSSSDSADTEEDSEADDSSETEAETEDEGDEDEADAADGDEEAVTEEGSEELTASYRGITESEIHIGVTMIDFDELKDFNLASEGWGDQQGVYQAFIDDINDRGGIHGRTVVPHFEFYSVLTAQAAEETCTALTQDIETFLVLEGFSGPAEVANNCIVTNNETIMIGGPQTAERLAAAKAPWVGQATLRDDRLPIFLQLLADNGYADNLKLAVVGSVEQKEIFDASGDILAEAGIEPVLSIQNDAPQGDLPATDARWQVLAENIRASDANTILVLGSGQGALRGARANGLDVDVWILEETDLTSLGEATTAADANGAITISSLTHHQEFEDPEMISQCYDIVTAALPDADVRDPDTVAPGEETWFRAIHSYCPRVKLFELLMTAAGPNPTQDTFQEAMDNMGDFSLPGLPFASLNADKVYTNDTYQLTRFDENLGDAGGLVPITDPTDGTP